MSDEQPSSSDVDYFRIGCALTGFFFLLFTQLGKLVYSEAHDRWDLDDFPQYYMGGLIAANGAWDSLYPIPDPESHSNPGIAATSRIRPGYQELAAKSGADGLTVYIQPPPVALLLIPLALLQYDDAMFAWLLLSCLAAWGVGLQAAKIYDLCRAELPGAKSRRDQRIGGLLILLICISPLTYHCVRIGNISAIVGWLIGVAVLSLIRRRDAKGDASGAAALLIGGVMKYASLVLLPLYVAKRRWRALIALSVMGLALLGLSAAIMGTGPYRTFLSDIAPTMGRSTAARNNMSLTGVILRMGQRETLSGGAAFVVRAASLLVLALIVVLIFSRPRRHWDGAGRVVGGVMALVSWLLVFSPIAWLHYFMYLLPFSGWLVVQARKSVLRGAVVVAIIGLSYVPLQMVPSFNPPEPIFSYPCFSLMLLLALAVWAMIWDGVGRGDTGA